MIHTKRTKNHTPPVRPLMKFLHRYTPNTSLKKESVSMSIRKVVVKYCPSIDAVLNFWITSFGHKSVGM